MKEFGSDFHYCTNYINNPICFKTDERIFYACGRQAITDLIFKNNWIRIWVPTYFCYDIIEYIRQTKIAIVYYNDSPIENDINIINSLSFKDGDVLLRMNYFGLRTFRDNSTISIPVIEDHSHDLFGDWAINSNADWCIGSLRKTIPIPEGGVIWSPKNHHLYQPKISDKNEELADKRLIAMKLKSQYLSDENIDKNIFRNIYVETERMFDKLPISTIDKNSLDYLSHFDCKKWNIQKKENWLELRKLNLKDISVLIPEDLDKCNPFSFVLKFPNKHKRDQFRNSLIKNYVYPAILWEIPQDKDTDIKSMSDKLLSIHCDGRFSARNLQELKNIIERLLEL